MGILSQYSIDHSVGISRRSMGSEVPCILGTIGLIEMVCQAQRSGSIARSPMRICLKIPCKLDGGGDGEIRCQGNCRILSGESVPGVIISNVEIAEEDSGCDFLSEHLICPSYHVGSQSSQPYSFLQAECRMPKLLTG